MKYIKTFENIKDFKIGDYVICIDAWAADLIKNNIYQIKYILDDKFELFGVDVNHYWNSSRFRLATEE